MASLPATSRRAPRLIAVLSLAWSAAVLIRAAMGASHPATLGIGDRVAAPDAFLTPEEAGVAVLVALLLVFVVWILTIVPIVLRSILALLLLPAAALTWAGRPSGRWLHLAWAGLALLVEAPVVYLSGGRDPWACAGLAYALGLLIVLTWPARRASAGWDHLAAGGKPVVKWAGVSDDAL